MEHFEATVTEKSLGFESDDPPERNQNLNSAFGGKKIRPTLHGSQKVKKSGADCHRLRLAHQTSLDRVLLSKQYLQSITKEASVCLDNT